MEERAFIECLPSVWAMCFAYMIVFKSLNTVKGVLGFPFCRWRNWGPETSAAVQSHTAIYASV
jgi:hypothetical protein